MSSSSGDLLVPASSNRCGVLGATPDTARASFSAAENDRWTPRPPRARSMKVRASLLIPASAGKAGPGLAEVITKSASANRRAIASVAWRRIISPAAATRMLKRFSASCTATRISSVIAEAHAGQRPSSSP